MSDKVILCHLVNEFTKRKIETQNVADQYKSNNTLEEMLVQHIMGTRANTLQEVIDFLLSYEKTETTKERIPGEKLGDV